MELEEADLESEARTRDISRLGMKTVPLTGTSCSLMQHGVVLLTLYCVFSPLVIANPRMTLSKKVLLHREGCLSVPSYTALVPRADAVKVRRSRPALQEWGDDG